MIDLLATLVIYQLANCLEYKAACPSKITQPKDCSVGHKPVIPQYNILVITHVLSFGN